ncbi:MAG: hypothetical protein ACQES2_02340 [Pseudomonadota bacterium]
MRYLKRACVVVLMSALVACGGDRPDTPEGQLRAAAAAVEAAAEARDHGDVMDYIADSYNDPHGYDRDRLGKLLRVYFFRHKNIDIVSTITRLERIGEGHYNMVVSAAMAGRGGSPVSADLRRFEVTWVDQSGDGDWQITRARWKD